MKYYLNCPVKNCSFQIGVEHECTWGEAKIAEATLKRHIDVHDTSEKTDAIFDMLMCLDDALPKTPVKGKELK